MKTLVDTNILIIYLLDPILDLEAKEKEILDAFINLPVKDLLILDFVLTEFCTLIQKGIPKKYNIKGTNLHKKLISDFVQYIEVIKNSYNIMKLTSEEFIEVIETYSKALQLNYTEEDNSIIDHSIAYLSKKNNYEILTLDTKLKKLVS